MRNTWVRVAAAATVAAMAVIVILAIATGRPAAEIVIYLVILAIMAGTSYLAIRKTHTK